MPEPKRDLWEMQARFTTARLEGSVGVAGSAGVVHAVEKTVLVPLSQRENSRPSFQVTTSRPNVFSLIANFFGRADQERAVREGHRHRLIGQIPGDIAALAVLGEDRGEGRVRRHGGVDGAKGLEDL
jgi:hypothetical protein